MDCEKKEDYIISPREPITTGLRAVEDRSRTPAIIGINRPVNEVVILPLERGRRSRKGESVLAGAIRASRRRLRPSAPESEPWTGIGEGG